MTEWCTEAWQVSMKSKNRATAQGTTDVLLLGYDMGNTTAAVVKRGVCNASRNDGDVCRMPMGHDGAHVPFSGELICTTGVYIIDRIVK